MVSLDPDFCVRHDTIEMLPLMHIALCRTMAHSVVSLSFHGPATVHPDCPFPTSLATIRVEPRAQIWRDTKLPVEGDIKKKIKKNAP